MSKGNTAKTQQEYWEWLQDKYKKLHPGGFTAEDFVEWAVRGDYAVDPVVDPRTILIKKARLIPETGLMV